MILPTVVPRRDDEADDDEPDENEPSALSDFLKKNAIYFWPGTRQQVAAVCPEEEGGAWFLVPQPGNGLPLQGVDDDGTIYVAGVSNPAEAPFLVYALEPTGIVCVECSICGEPEWIGHARKYH